MTVSQKTFATVTTAQFFDDLFTCSRHKRLIFDGIGGITDDTQQCGIGLFGDRLTGQKAFECETGTRHVTRIDVNNRFLTGKITEKIQTINRLQCRFCHTDRTAVDFGRTVVDLVSPLPDTVVGSAVTAADVVDEILDKIDLILRIDDRKPRSGHLRDHQQKERRRIDLQMPPLPVPNNRQTGVGTVFGVECVDRIECVFELLHFIGLTHHRRQKPSHQFDDTLGQESGTVMLAEISSIRKRQSPDTKNAVNIVPHPRIRVVAVRVDGGTGGQQSRYGILPGEDDLLHHHKVSIEDI